jgi:hypothetical protein
VTKHFPLALGVDDFIARLEMALAAYGFTGDNAIAMSNLCRDESCMILEDKIESVFGSCFSTHGLGGVLTCGVIGMSAGLSHSPVENVSVLRGCGALVGGWYGVRLPLPLLLLLLLRACVRACVCVSRGPAARTAARLPACGRATRSTARSPTTAAADARRCTHARMQPTPNTQPTTGQGALRVLLLPAHRHRL